MIDHPYLRKLSADTEAETGGGLISKKLPFYEAWNNGYQEMDDQILQAVICIRFGFGERGG